MYEWLQRWFARSAEALPVQAEAPGAPAPACKPAPARLSRVSFEQKNHVDTHYYAWLFDAAQEPADLDVNPQERQVLDALDSIVHSAHSGADLVRRLPGLIPQMLQSLRSDNFSGADIARKLSNDVVLVAAVIRLANIAILHSGKRIVSVEHAIIVIGQEGLRQLITSVAFRPILDVKSGHYTRLLAPRIWDQSERCAMASRMLAERFGVDPFDAFLAGLVQNVGLMVALRLMDQMATDRPRLGSDMFCASLVHDARLLACRIGREWKFPETVTLAIREQENMQKGATISPLGRLLALTDYLSKLRIMTEHSRLSDDDPQLFQGLPENELECYRKLNALADVGLAEAAA